MGMRRCAERFVQRFKDYGARQPPHQSSLNGAHAPLVWGLLQLLPLLSTTPAPDSLSSSSAVDAQAAGIRILASAPNRYQQLASTAEPVMVMSAADWHAKGQVRETNLESSL